MYVPYRVELLESEIESIYSLVNTITACPSDNPDLFCLQSKEASNHIPERIRYLLLLFINNPYLSRGYIIFVGLLNNNKTVPLTPISNMCKIGEQTIIARIQSLFINVIGEMIAYEAEGYGNLFQDIVPSKCMTTKQTSSSSDIELEIHTEQAFSQFKPDILSLGCLRSDENAITYILHINQIIKELTDTEIKLLKQPLWKCGIDLSFKLQGFAFKDGEIRGPFPIIQENGFLIFDQDLMFGITNDAQQMIKKITDIYYKNRSAHILSEGEIILIDNRYAVHGRSPFCPKYNGRDRFLVRCFGTLDYEKSKSVRKGHTISALYS